MIKLNYNPVFEFSSLDIMDFADSEPIIYRGKSQQSVEFAALCQQWVNGGRTDLEPALEIVGRGIISVSQNGQVYPLDGMDGAKALRDAIEADNPGFGDDFIKHLAYGYYVIYYSRVEKRLGNSKMPSARSADGNNPAT